ncbi:MAG: hypothetical protein ACJ8G1_04465 [Vitreoscilla sp.]
MRARTRRRSMGLAALALLVACACQPAAWAQCRPAASAPPTGGVRPPVPANLQNVACGDVTISLAAPPAASAASTPSPAASAGAVAPAAGHEALRLNGLFVAATALGLAVIVMVFGFWCARGDRPIAINRDSIRFGGAGHGWEASPALAALVAAGVIAALALMLAVQALDFGQMPAKAETPSAREKS